MRDSELFDLYMSDTRENLNEISRNMLLLEKDVTNSEYINNIFRAAHTIKGAAATLQFEEITKVTHKIEDLFGAIRDGKLSATNDIVDSVFAALDVLELLHEKIEDESIEVDLSVIDVLHSYIDGTAIPASVIKQEVANTKNSEIIENPYSRLLDDNIHDRLLTNEIKEIINYILSDNFSIYFMSIKIDDNSVSKGARAYMVLRDLAEFGEPISISPSVEEIEDPNFNENEINMLFVSKEPIDDITFAINDILEVEVAEVEKITKLEKDDEGEDFLDFLHSDLVDTPTNTATPSPSVNSAAKTNHTSVAQTQPIANKVEPANQTPQRIKPKESNTYVKVYTKTLDELMNEQGELLLEYNRLMIANDRFNKGQINQYELSANVSDIAGNINKIINNQQEIIMSTRMFPLDQLFQVFPKMIRDLSRTLDKKINLTIDGQDTKLDRTILEKVSDPLKHIIRNAVDHGIESPADRIAAGKSELGNVYLSAKQENSNVIITVTDDGKGLDKEVLKRKAVEKGIYSQEQVDKLTDEEIYGIILLPGFSTASQVTEVSGRGVGMDIVKNNISEIGGVMVISSEKGQGTTFTLKIPFTLAISKAVLTNVENDKYVVLINYIKEIVDVPMKEIKRIQNREHIILRDKIYPLIYLRDVYGYEREGVKEEETVLIIENNTRSIGLVVDTCLGEMDIVIKNLPTYFTGNTKYITGITKLGDGSIPVIVDVSSIVEEF